VTSSRQEEPGRRAVGSTIPLRILDHLDAHEPFRGTHADDDEAQGRDGVPEDVACQEKIVVVAVEKVMRALSGTQLLE